MRQGLLADALDTLLACPVCHGTLKFEGSGDRQIRCLTCGSRFPINDGIPVLFGGGGGAQNDEQAFRDALAKQHLDDAPQALVRVATRHHCESVMRKRAGEFYGQFEPSQWVLDLGVGFGWYWAGAAGVAKIVGMDLSMGNLRLAKKVLSADEDKVLLICSDAGALPIRNHAIAGVWSVQVFQHFPQQVLSAVQGELDRVLSDEFSIELHNLNPAALYRFAYFIAGKSFHRHGKIGSMERNCYTMKEWHALWRCFRQGQAGMSGGYSELFFHPDLHLCVRPYPLQLEKCLARLAPKFAALFARQVQIRIESRGLNSAAVRLAAGDGLPPECALVGSVGARPS